MLVPFLGHIISGTLMILICIFPAWDARWIFSGKKIKTRSKKWLYFFRYIWLGESYILFGGYSLLNIAMYGYIGGLALKYIFQTQNLTYFSKKKWSTWVWEKLSGHLDLISRRRELGKRENYLDRSARGARIYHVGRWKPLCNIIDREKFWLLNRHLNTSIHS